MKDIKIKKLALENFKCHKSLTLELNGRNASVYGDNAAGKTSIYDALTWLLFGKDSKGNGEKNIEIKPLDANGEIRDHLAETAVEAVLLVDGEEITLRRTLKEIWTTKRGHSEQTYDGNTSEYFIDGVPVKKYTFTDKVTELVIEDTFRMLTSVSHFADGISWQDRRAVLFKVAAVAPDEAIMATEPRFLALSTGMGKLSVDDYKRKLTAEKRGLVTDKTEIPARISECQKTIEDVQGLDFGKAQVELTNLTAKRERLEAELLSIEHDTASDKKRMEIREAQLELSALDNENKAFRASQIAGAPDIAGLRNNLSRLQTQRKAKELSISAEKSYCEKLDREISEARERWIAVNGETFIASACPTCGQALPAQKLKEATDNFEAQKAKRLREIEQTANASKGAKAAAEARVETAAQELAVLDSEIIKATGAITTAESNVIPVVDMEGYAERKAAVEAHVKSLEGELADMAQSTAGIKSELQSRIREVIAEAEKQRIILSNKMLLEYSTSRIAELQESARKAAAALEAVDNMLYLIEEYTRYKTQYVEDSINSMFRVAKFRLFREQANGGVEDRCDVVYQGVPYINLNNGAKINVGIDIINTLSTAYGVSVPLFVDNAESVTRLEHSNNQIIRLVVSEEDKELRVNYEN
jgi:DNA repair exonuclease SbcCD ATPase subunit